MRRPLARLAAPVLVAAALGGPALAGDAPDPLRFGTDKAFVSFAPFAQVDVAGLSASPDRLLDGVDPSVSDLRRARLYTDFGYGDLGGRLTIDFAPKDGPQVLYAYVDYALAEHLTATVGQQNLVFSLEDLMGSRNAIFNEDGANASLLPGDLTGASLSYGTDRFSLTGAVYGSDINKQPFDDGHTLSARGTLAPYLDGEDAVHLGVAVMASFDARTPRSFSGNAGSSLFGVSTIKTGAFETAERFLAGNLEVAATLGRFTLQSEYTLGSIDDRERGESRLHGGYLAALLFLTDDHRLYDGASGTFKKVKPRVPAGEGLGAIEAGLRLDHLDLADAGPAAGAQWAGTAIVNWYPAEKFRLSLSHAVTGITAGPDDGDTYQTTLGRFSFIY